MSLLTAVLTASFVILSSASDATDAYILDSSIDPCEEAGQYQIKNKILSLLEKPANLPKNPKWPKDPLEDDHTPEFDKLLALPEDQRWRQIGLMKAFNPAYFQDTLQKEIRDNMLCNLKRMECMSIDDIATPMSSLNGQRAWYAMYDALPDSQKPAVNSQIQQLRQQVIEPMMSAYYRMVVRPSKDFVESLVPAGYPYDPIPSMPSDTEGDWNVQGKYPGAGTASLPTPNGPAYRSNRKATYSLVQMADKSRQRCNDMSTEAKKIMCHLDYGVVMTKIARGMKKRGELPELTTSEGDSLLASLDQIDAKVTAMKQVHRTACMSAKDI